MAMKKNRHARIRKKKEFEPKKEWGITMRSAACSEKKGRPRISARKKATLIQEGEREKEWAPYRRVYGGGALLSRKPEAGGLPEKKGNERVLGGRGPARGKKEEGDCSPGRKDL